MGFPRSDIDRAMRAAFHNPDRAVEYLLNGIPEAALREQTGAGTGAGAGAGAGTGAPTGGAQAQNTAQTQAASGGNPTDATAGSGGDASANLFDLAAQAGRGGSGPRSAGSGTGAGAGAGAGGLDAAIAGAGTGDDGRPNFDFLRNNPIFQQLRQVVQQQPQMLEPILQQVAAGNPQLAQIISQHPEDFMQLLAEDVDDDAQLPAGAQQIAVSEEEREAIERVSVPNVQEMAHEGKLTSYSCADLALSVIWPSRHILHATRTRSWQRIFSLITPMTMKRVRNSDVHCCLLQAEAA